LSNLALILRDQRKFDDAEKLFREGLAIDRRVYGDDHPEVAQHLNNLGGLQVSAGRPVDAEQSFRDALGIQRRAFAENSWQVATTMSLLANALIRQTRYAEAESLAVRSFEIIRRQFGDAHGRTQAALARVIAVYDGLRRPDRAADYRALLAKR
jgi:tetratricopeptide (TPR) repeat protein